MIWRGYYALSHNGKGEGVASSAEPINSHCKEVFEGVGDFVFTSSLPSYRYRASRIEN